MPFLFATNGRPYVRQWLTKSGIWYRDVRRETNHAIAMTSWFSPKDLVDKLATDVDKAAQGLAEESFGKGRIRPYQEEAIAAIENAVVAGQRDILVSMATGTGKTRTAMAPVRLLLPWAGWLRDKRDAISRGRPVFRQRSALPAGWGGTQSPSIRAIGPHPAEETIRIRSACTS